MFRCILVVCILLSLQSKAQKISAREAIKYVGKRITVCDRVFGGIFIQKSKSQPTFLNVGAAYPNAPLTIVIWLTNRKKFRYKPEDYYKGRNVCITGEIIVYKGKAEMVVDDPDQIELSN